MISIRQYKYFSDYRMLEAWCSHYDQGIPFEDLFPKESTFIVEYNGQPMGCMSIIYTNVKRVAFFENLYGNPLADSKIRKECLNALFSYCHSIAIQNGVTDVLGMAANDKIVERVGELGYELRPSKLVHRRIV